MATLLLAKNGGAAASGAIDGAIGDSIQLSAAIAGSPTTEWRIHSYPEGFAPGGTWVADDDDAVMPAFIKTGTAAPSAFTAIAGYYEFTLTVDGVVYTSTDLLVPTEDGLRPLGRREGSRRGGAKMRWALSYNRNVDALQTALDGIRQDVALTPVDYEDPLVFDGLKSMTMPSGSGSRKIALATSGHVDESVIFLRIPAGNAPDGINPAPNLNISGDVFNPEEDALIRMLYSGGRWDGDLTSTPTPDTDNPTVLSATVFQADTDALVVVCDRAISFESLVGLSLTFSVGTARTITGLLSGDGTTTLTFSLSGAVAGTDVFSFVVAATNGLPSMNGQPMLAQTRAGTNSVVPPLTGVILDWDVSASGSVSTSGGKVTSIADQSVNANTGVQATDAKRPTYNATDATLNNNPSIAHDHTIKQVLNRVGLTHEGGALGDKQSYSLFMLLKRSLNATQIYAEFTDATGVVFTGPIAYSNVATDLRADASTTTYSSYSTTAWHRLAITYNGATGVRKIYINDVEVASGTAAFNPAALTRLSVGWANDEVTLTDYAASMTWNRITFLDHLTAPGNADFDGWSTITAARMA